MVTISAYNARQHNGWSRSTSRGRPSGIVRQRSYSAPIRQSPRLSGGGFNSSPMSISSFMSGILPAAASFLGGPLAGLAADMATQTFMRHSQSGPWAEGLQKGPRRYGNGKWTGYVKRKRVSKKKRKRVLKRSQNAFHLSVEKSGTQTPTVSAVLGHSTISRQYATRLLFGGLLRKILSRAGVKCSSPSAALTPMVVNTKVGMEFQYGAGTNDGFSITVGAVPITFSQLLDAFINEFNTKYDSIVTATPASPIHFDLRLRNIYITSTSADTAKPGNFHVDLTNAYINVYSTSRLKIQNRSINTPGDDDANDVDNVPINCVSYSGNGTGLDSRYDFLGLGFCADQDCIIKTTDPVLAGDAPLPALLTGVKKSGFLRIQPGGIKTDVIKHKINMPLDTYCRNLLGPRTNNNQRLRMGKFSFVHYEKTLEANNAAPVAMNIAYENQLFSTCKINVKYNDVPIPEFYRS